MNVASIYNYTCGLDRLLMQDQKNEPLTKTNLYILTQGQQKVVHIQDVTRETATFGFPNTENGYKTVKCW